MPITESEVRVGYNETMRALGLFVVTNEHSIANALGNHVAHMRKAADEAIEAYATATATPEAKAAQDASLMTTNGLLRSAEIFQQEAAKAQGILDKLNELLEQHYESEEQ